jgi:uncharacterized protein (DUF488 family)
MKFIYTVGTGNRSIDELIDILCQYDIQYLVDVRSIPYSKWNNSFNGKELEERITKECKTYIFMGDLLGGRPNDVSCYTNGWPDYTKIAEKEFYKKGIVRLVKGVKQKLRIALLCSELNPDICHRKKLIGETLSELGIKVYHIDKERKLKKQ